jgi:hypothetical protein
VANPELAMLTMVKDHSWYRLSQGHINCDNVGSYKMAVMIKGSYEKGWQQSSRGFLYYSDGPQAQSMCDTAALGLDKVISHS